jgi:DNA-binding transcriptional LysR family regulator
MIETSQLQTLAAVSKEGNYSKAADRLGVTQSAISQSMKGLEARVGVPLVRKVGKKIVLTFEGEKLRDLADSFLHNMETTLEELKHDNDSMSGRVRVGTLNGVGKSWLAPTLLEFSVNNPELEIQVALGFQDDLIRDFENRSLDILILPEGSLPSVGKRKFLSKESSTLVFPNSPKFKISKDITLEELANLPTVLFEKDDHLYLKWCRERFSKQPSTVNVKYTVNSHGNMLQAVSKGVGVAVVPTHVLKRSFFKYDISTLGAEFEVPNYNFYLAYHEDAENVVRMKETIKILMSVSNPLELYL